MQAAHLRLALLLLSARLRDAGRVAERIAAAVTLERRLHLVLANKAGGAEREEEGSRQTDVDALAERKALRVVLGLLFLERLEVGLSNNAGERRGAVQWAGRLWHGGRLLHWSGFLLLHANGSSRTEVRRRSELERGGWREQCEERQAIHCEILSRRKLRVGA